MKLEVTPKVAPDYGLYEEDCCGSHPGEWARLTLTNSLQLDIRRIDSGIGPEFKIIALHETEQREVATVFVDDDGELCIYRGGKELLP